MPRNHQRRITPWILVVLLFWNPLLLVAQTATSPVANANQAATTPGWLLALDRFLPFLSAGKLIDRIFLDPQNPTKAKEKVSRKDAEANLTKVSDDVRSALAPVNDQIRRLTSWRRFANEVAGVGSDPLKGSFKDSIIQMEALVENAELIAEPNIPKATAKIEGLYKDCLAEWQLIWVLGTENKNISSDVEETLEKMKGALGRLGKRVQGLQGSKPAEQRRTIIELKTEIYQVHDGLNELARVWDTWNRSLASEFVIYMQKFGAKPDENIVIETQRAASASFDLTETAQMHQATSVQLQEQEQLIENTRQRLAALSAPGSPGGSSDSKSAGGLLGGREAQETAEADRYRIKERLDEQVKHYKKLQTLLAVLESRAARAKTELEQLVTFRQLSIEAMVEALESK